MKNEIISQGGSIQVSPLEGGLYVGVDQYRYICWKGVIYRGESIQVSLLEGVYL